jgi:hypothetical protein
VRTVDWYLEAVSFGNCNCAYGCPCQFEALPTHGDCRGFEVATVTQGYFGDTRLDGVKYALTYAWPGPVFRGNGEMQAIIDAGADEAQRAALIKILYGEETEEGATHWWVYRAMCAKVHEPLIKPIECEIDIAARRARVAIPGVLDSQGRPITSPATGQEHRVRIEIPSGIEFEVAEIGSASTRCSGAVKLDLTDSYGQFNVTRHSGSGVVHGA